MKHMAADVCLAWRQSHYHPRAALFLPFVWGYREEGEASQLTEKTDDLEVEVEGGSESRLICADPC